MKEHSSDSQAWPSILRSYPSIQRRPSPRSFDYPLAPTKTSQAISLQCSSRARHTTISPLCLSCIPPILQRDRPSTQATETYFPRNSSVSPRYTGTGSSTRSAGCSWMPYRTSRRPTTIVRLPSPVPAAHRCIRVDTDDRPITVSARGNITGMGAVSPGLSRSSTAVD